MEALFGTNTAQMMVNQEVSVVDHQREPGTVRYDVQNLNFLLPPFVQSFGRITGPAQGSSLLDSTAEYFMAHQWAVGFDRPVHKLAAGYSYQDYVVRNDQMTCT